MRFNKYTPMSGLWHHVKPHFSPLEAWGDKDRIDARIVFALFDIREHSGRKIVINCGYEPRSKPSWHSSYLAVDFHIDGLHVCDQYLLCSRYDVFNGLGVYPYWNNPGLHGDSRPHTLRHRPEARWISTSAGVYAPLTWKDLSQINGDGKQWLLDLLEKHSIKASSNIISELTQTVDRIAKEAYEKGKKRK